MSATTTDPNQPAHRNEAALLWHQFRYEQLSFWRNPQSAFFTFFFPVVIFVIFGLIFNDKTPSDFYNGATSMQYYTPTIIALSVMGACYSQLAIVLSLRRQNGILKRLRATPLPATTYFLGLLLHCIVLSVVEVVLIAILGKIYGVPMPSKWGVIAVVLVLGAAAFCALGVAVASLIRNAEAAPALVQFVFFPLVFISGNYFPIHSSVLNHIADIFPVRPFNQSLLRPFAYNQGFHLQYLLTLAAWGVVGSLVAIWRFRWDPKPE